MSEHYKLKKIVPPTEAQLAERREKIHADHLDYFYGDHWSIFIDKANRCFLEFDVGHFASEFIVREITRKDYDSLKRDKSLFTQISRKVR
jgi:hypothetical protein